MTRNAATVFLSAAIALVASASSQAAPILEYRFNGTGTTTTSTGSDSAQLQFLSRVGSANVATDLHSAAGTGVGGDLVGHADFGTDRAYNGGAYVDSGAAGVNTTSTSLVGLTSWTVSGWFKAPAGSPINGGGRAILNTTASSNSFNTQGFNVRIHDNTGGSLRVNHGAGHLSPSQRPYSEVDKWVFFAVSYDSATRDAKFYRGYRSADEAGSNSVDVTLVETLANAGSGSASPGSTPGFFVGGWIRAVGDVAQAFPGLLDNVRVEGATSGSAGALSAATLDVYRAADVAVPEPVAAGSLAITAGLLISRRRSK